MSENLPMAMPKISLGVRDMLLCAIHEHSRKDPAHEKPRRFELHPAVIVELLKEFSHAEMMTFGTVDHDRMMFCGVEIVADRLATRPKMITAYNKVEYL